MPDITLLSLVSFDDDQLQKLSAVSPRLDIHQYPYTPFDELPQDLSERVEILYGWGKAIFDAHRFPQLKWLQTHSAGVDYLVDKPIWQRSVLISSLNGVHAVPMAEHALAMILAFRGGLPLMEDLKARREWPRGRRWQLFARPELHGSTLGIVGYGAVGRHLGRMAHGLGMRVLATTRSGRRRTYTGWSMPDVGDAAARIPATIYAVDRLAEMLPQCDYVVLLAPLTPETLHLFDAGTLACMKEGAVLINLARGGLVVESDLLAALRSGHLAGAGLDVFDQEPLPRSSPLWSERDVIISPHVSGFTPQYDERASDLFAANIRRYLQGEALVNQVDRDRGY